MKHDINYIEYQHFLNIFYRNFKQTCRYGDKVDLKGNRGKFMTKDLHTAIMKRSRLGKKCLRDGEKRPKKNTKSKAIFLLTS